MLKIAAALAGMFLIALPVVPQRIQEESLVINVEVPVRVFDGDAFVDNLAIDDFEILEDGQVQKLEAVYLVKKRSIERSEEKNKFSPKTARNFFLIFEITDFNPQLAEAVEYFIEKVFFPGDKLTLITPVKTYRLRDETFEFLPKEEVVRQMTGLLRRDSLIGSSEYRKTMDDLSSLARSLTFQIQQGMEFSEESGINSDDISTTEFGGMSLDLQLTNYAALLSRLENLRSVNPSSLERFGEILKSMEGQKYVFLIYEKEYIPKLDPRILNTYRTLYQDRPDIEETLTTLFEFHTRDVALDIERLKQMYSDSSISMQFLFISGPPDQLPGISLEEHSEDIFSAFREMAQATGGMTVASANPLYSIRRAVEAADNYYLLYYFPQNFKRDGNFRRIQVRVKNRNYRITHRFGYFAN